MSAAWAIFLATVILGVLDWLDDDVAWRHLLNDRAVQWAQWLLLGAGLVLMLFEDAGDARHTIFG